MTNPTLPSHAEVLVFNRHHRPGHFPCVLPDEAQRAAVTGFSPAKRLPIESASSIRALTLRFLTRASSWARERAAQPLRRGF